MAEHTFSEVVEIRGHIIDSAIFTTILDELLDRGVEFDIHDVQIGHRREEPSYARIEIRARSPQELEALLDRVGRLGAAPVRVATVKVAPAPADGVFPDDFYSTTNLRTLVNIDGVWTPVEYPEMDCAILVDPESRTARCVTLNEVRAGDTIVVGHEGVRVVPLERPRSQPPVFAFMGSNVSAEKPNPRLIREIAQRMQEIRAGGDKILVVGGPVLIHTGSQREMTWLIEHGYVHALFTGNGLAAHDVEAALFGTSLGVSLETGMPMERGHEHHLRAINIVRRAGGIRQAVEQGILKTGIMHACVQHGVEYVLAGSIRDDGPLPDVITDTQVAQGEMRRVVRSGVRLALFLASMLHGIATGNLLPAEVTTVCVDIEPAVVTKLSDRGTFQNVSIVADVGSFLRELVLDLQTGET